MDKKSLRIDVEKIHNQVKREILADEKYNRENDAKLRAIEQRVPTYEDFRQIVLASHLKPLDKGESLRNNIKNGQNVWNSACSHEANIAGNDINKLTLNASNELLTNAKPKTVIEFLKVWNKLENDDAKFTFLKRLGEKEIFQLFSVEINGDVMGKFLNLFNSKLNENKSDHESAKFIYTLLILMTKCNRFELNKMFLKTAEIQCCKNIAQVLESLNIFDDNELKTLKKCYC